MQALSSRRQIAANASQHWGAQRPPARARARKRNTAARLFLASLALQANFYLLAYNTGLCIAWCVPQRVQPSGALELTIPQAQHRETSTAHRHSGVTHLPAVHLRVPYRGYILYLTLDVGLREKGGVSDLWEVSEKQSPASYRKVPASLAGPQCPTYLLTYVCVCLDLYVTVPLAHFCTSHSAGCEKEVCVCVCVCVCVVLCVCLQKAALPLKIAQTAAVLEVVHSAVGLVRSPVFITGT